jgi:hypothetical protein
MVQATGYVDYLAQCTNQPFIVRVTRGYISPQTDAVKTSNVESEVFMAM